MIIKNKILFLNHYIKNAFLKAGHNVKHLHTEERQPHKINK